MRNKDIYIIHDKIKETVLPCAFKICDIYSNIACKSRSMLSHGNIT